MKLLALVIACLLITPAMAEDELNPKLANVPKELLSDGLTTLSACIGLDTAGIFKLQELAKAEQEEPSSDTKTVRQNLTRDAQMLLLGATDMVQVDKWIIEALIKWHNGDGQVLSQQVMDIAKTSRDEALDHLKDVSSYDEFMDYFTDPLGHCNDATDALEKRLQDAVKGLESSN